MSTAVDAQHNVSVKRKSSSFMYFYHIAVVLEFEVRKLRKDPIEVFLRIVQPVLWLLVFGQVFSQIKGIPTDGATYLEYLTPGILAQSITFVSIFYGISIIWEKDIGLLQKFLATPIRRSALIIGKMLSASVRSISQAIFILLLALLIGVQLDWGVLTLLGVMFSITLGASFFSGLSMVLASLVRTRERMMGIGQLIIMPLFFASSALYPIAIMPNWLKIIAIANPLSYLVDSLRGLLLVSHQSQLWLDWGILLIAATIITMIASALFPRIVN
jgi:ABC-2 type transport system permease protein